MAGIVACFVLHFGQRRFLAAASLEAEASTSSVGAGDADSFDLEICNHAKAGRVYGAVAYYDAAQADWVTRGWFAQGEDSCQVTLRHLPPPVYVYAETRDAARHWDDPVAGARFCLDGEHPFIWLQRRCEARGDVDARFVQFKELPTPEVGGIYRWEIRE